MNASTIITDDMTLEEKLAAIDKAMARKLDEVNTNAGSDTSFQLQRDPYEDLMCEGCQ